MIITIPMFAQEKAKQIAKIWRDIEHVSQKYDDRMDSIYQIICQNIETSQNDEEMLAIWHSCLAQFYQMYAEQVWLIERTEMAETPADFKEWDRRTLLRHADEQWRLSLTHTQRLQTSPIEMWKPLLNDTSDLSLTPSLYDVLALRYQDYLLSADRLAWENFDNLPLADLWDIDAFHKAEIPLSENPTRLQQLMLLYQEWSQYLYELPQKRAFIFRTLSRYKTMHQHNMDLQNDDFWFVGQLHRLEKSFNGYDGEEILFYTIGETYRERAKNYDMGQTADADFKDDYIRAVEYFEKAIALSPTSPSGMNAKVQLAQIKASSLDDIYPTTASFTVAPERPALAILRYANLPSCWLTIYKMSYDDFMALKSDFSKKKLSKLSKFKIVYKEQVVLPEHHDYRSHTGYVEIPALPVGSYFVIVSETPVHSGEISNSKAFFHQVSDMEILKTGRSDNCTLLVVNRTTGEPISGATVMYEHAGYDSNDRSPKSGVAVSNAKGFVNIKVPNARYLKLYSVKWNSQILSLDQFSSRYGWNRPGNYVSQTGTFFTDRSLYRPGQKVYFKGILREESVKNGESVYMKVMPHTNVKVLLRDVNRSIVDQQLLTTNEYGSVEGTFELPVGGLTGEFTLEYSVEGISMTQHGVTFKVEEYKRPTFEVTIDQPKETFLIGQTVRVEGMAEAFAGYGIADAQVQYTVQRVVTYPWCRYWRPRPTESEQVALGETHTDADGRFHIDFLAKEYRTGEPHPMYNFKVEVTVTDLNGETHTGATFVTISDIPVLLSADIPDELLLDDLQMRFPVSLTNISSQPVSGKVQYQILSLKTPSDFLYPLKEVAEEFVTEEAAVRKDFPLIDFAENHKRDCWVSHLIERGEIAIDKSEPAFFYLSDLQNLSEGYYKIVFFMEYAPDQRVEKEYIIYVYSRGKKKCTAYEALWVAAPEQIEAGETLQVTVGSYLRDAQVLYEVSINGKLLESRWINLSQSTCAFSVSVPDSIDGRVCVHLFTMQNGHAYDVIKTVCIPNTRQQIQVQVVRFKNKTLPGSQEEYQLRLVDKDGNPVQAEMLCTMYDYSLDALGVNHHLGYNMLLHHARYEHELSAIYTSRYGFSYANTNFGELKDYPSVDFNFLSFNDNPRMFLAKNSFAMASRSVNGDVFDLAMDEVVIADAGAAVPENFATAAVQFEWDGDLVEGEAVSQKEEVQVRANFDETAFFYPMLRTDEEGNVFVSFTMPESLTKWKMQGIAHNPDLQYGRIEKYVQTHKEVMLVPNAPRFLREGDTMVFSAKVVNRSTSEIKGYVTLQFFDAVTQAPVAMADNFLPVPYSIAAGGVQEVHFEVAVPFGLSAVNYRMIARNLSPEALPGDGEEKMLPVLTNRILVTETMPLHISGVGEKRFTFDRLRQSFTNPNGTLEHYKLTMEFTPNPIWYALQAMPYLMEYPHECNEQVFSRFYSNKIASAIINANPRIKETFERWQLESPDAFCSALEKNQELKQVVLEETPWVLDAQREGANKQNVAILFDLKRMANEEKKALQHLSKMQNRDGGWAWFSDGESDAYITTHIVAGFGHLNALSIPVDNVNMIYKAVEYMDAQMQKRYKERKKLGFICYNETHYLYARSFFLSKQIAKQYKSAYDTCYKATMKDWKSQSYYTQAMLALVAYRNGDRTVALQILQYLKSMAQHDEEMGMFWKEQGHGYCWYERPIERQAMLIEAFHTITPEDEASVEEMQLWLLKQKQTQHWGTTKATTEAIYALMFNKADVVESDATVTVGGHAYPDADTPVELGSGYFETSWDGHDIIPEMSEVVVRKGDPGPAWGGVYWQYFEHIDKVSESDDRNLKIQKDLFKVVNNGQHEVLTPIMEESPLQVGDRVRVRVVLTSDRDMEYVHMKDMRAAAFEPVNVFSQHKYQDGLSYYESTKDVATHFFIERLPKGKYVFEYMLTVTMAGTYSNGITHIECMYAPEFQSHSQGIRVKVE